MEQSNLFTEMFEDERKHKQILPLLHCFGTNLLLKAEKEYNSTNPNSVPSTWVLSWQLQRSSVRITLIQAYSNKISRKQFRDLNMFGLEFDACRYCKKNMPCQCLKNIYQRLKSLPKLGECQSCHKKSEANYSCADVANSVTTVVLDASQPTFPTIEGSVVSGVQIQQSNVINQYPSN